VSVGAVIFESERVLLIRRGHAPLKGDWSLPGGVVEVVETLSEALRREVLEETGLTVEVGPLVEVIDRIQRAPDDRVEYHFVILDYLCRADGGSAGPGSDAADVRWVAIGELSQYRLAERVTAVVHSAFEMRHGV
jgi:ADP-ribose pyrophosphatase YjhB (NUDIX family)